MSDINYAPHWKQHLALEAFNDATTTEILYGGSAGGGKSYFLCALIHMQALTCPGVRIGLARNELVTLKKTTMVSFHEVAADWGIQDLYTYNSTAGVISYANGSEVVLVELRRLPRDPAYTRLGGLLLTFGVVDELGEVHTRGYDIFRSRLGRWRNTELGIKSICVSTCNPIKNWLYKKWYTPFKEGTLDTKKKFIQALPTDNPHLPAMYIENLQSLPWQDRERLLYGNWDYEDAEDALMSYAQINNIFTPVLDSSPPTASTTYLTADIAFTSDKCVFMVWHNWTITHIRMLGKDEDPETVILELMKLHNIPAYNVAYDADGVGKFLSRKLTTAIGIVNNARAEKDENYKNLKTQLFYRLSEYVINNTIRCTSTIYQKDIIDELQSIRHSPTADVSKLSINSKDEQKRILGHSPDLADAMAYRMIFLYKSTKPSQAWSIGSY